MFGRLLLGQAKQKTMKTRSTGTVHTPAKARLTNVASAERLYRPILYRYIHFRGLLPLTEFY